MVVCGALLLAGVAAIVRWGGLQAQPPWPAPDPDDHPSPATVARRYLWYVTLAVVSGVVPGILVAGAGGRLIMRLLAATAGDSAQGRVTEAEEIVGEISVGGTIGFIVFTGVFFGLATGALFLLLRRWLPGGRLRGLAFGGVLLAVAATRVEPLRRDNPDFDIVGPGWLSVLAFTALVLVHGMCVAAVAGRYSRALPLVSGRRRDLLAYAPLLLTVPVAGLLLPVALVGVVVIFAGRAPGLVAAIRSPGFTTAGRVVLAVLVLIAFPGFVSAAADILGRGP